MRLSYISGSFEGTFALDTIHKTIVLVARNHLRLRTRSLWRHPGPSSSGLQGLWVHVCVAE